MTRNFETISTSISSLAKIDFNFVYAILGNIHLSGTDARLKPNFQRRLDLAQKTTS